MRGGRTGEPEPLRVHVTDDGRVLVHVGTRFVDVTMDELEGTLELVAANGGSVLYSRDDPGEEPGPVALEVMRLVAEHDVELATRDETRDELDDAGL